MIENSLNHQEMWHNLLRLADRLSNQASVNTEMHNHLTISQIRVAAIIFEHYPNGVMLKEIADELALTPGAVSQTVDILVREGIIERTTDPNDRRAIQLRPAELGLEMRKQHTTRLNNTVQQISVGVSAEDYQIFIKVLKHLRGAMDKLNQTGNNK